MKQDPNYLPPAPAPKVPWRLSDYDRIVLKMYRILAED